MNWERQNCCHFYGPPGSRGYLNTTVHFSTQLLRDRALIRFRAASCPVPEHLLASREHHDASNLDAGIAGFALERRKPQRERDRQRQYQTAHPKQPHGHPPNLRECNGSPVTFNRGFT